MSMVHWCSDNDGKTEVFGAIPVSVPLQPSQIPHGLAWHWIWASAIWDLQH